MIWFVVSRPKGRHNKYVVSTELPPQDRLLRGQGGGLNQTGGLDDRPARVWTTAGGIGGVGGVGGIGVIGGVGDVGGIRGRPLRGGIAGERELSGNAGFNRSILTESVLEPIWSRKNLLFLMRTL